MVRSAAALAIVLAIGSAGGAEESATLSIAGELSAPGKLTLTDLKALGPAPVEWTVHGRKRVALGVPLEKILTKAGFSAGPMGKDVPVREKRSGWKKAVLASAADGFQAVFSCAELFPEMGPTRAFVAWEVDGKPLSPEEAPFRLVVTTDKEPSRSLYKLTRLEVVDLGGR
jgi:DMSO/TMAO reductase YedYZ molybdopterin-dependent catalytic subunit